MYWGAPWRESVRAGEPATGPSAGGCRSGAVHRACGTTNSAETPLNITNTTNNQRRKRKRKDDDEKGPPEQVPKLDAEQSSRPFACPFYLYDRHTWHNCLRNYTLKRVVDVRGHLTRAHLLGPQCPICFEEFKQNSSESSSADDRFNAHVLLRTCQPPPSPPPARHGLTRDQFEALQTTAKRRNGRRAADSAAEKWFEIWDIAFPDEPRPLSPYLDDHPDIQRIRDMNDNILGGEQWRNLTAPARGSSPSLQNASRNTIRTITERLLTFYRRMYEDPDQPDQAAPETSSNTTAPDTTVPSSMGESLRHRHSWELMSTPSQPTQATEDPPPSLNLGPAATGHDPGTFQQTQEYPSLGGQSHNINMTQVDRPPSPFETDMSFLMDATFPDSIYGIPDVNDPFEPPGRTATPSQYFTNDYGPNPSGLWRHPGGDTTDQA